MRSNAILRRVARIALAAAIFAGIGVSIPSGQAVGASAAPDTWAATGAMSQARGFAPAVRLGDGSVITAGGTDGVAFTAAAERWTISGQTWTPAGSIGQAVAGGVGALLPNGKAIFAGGAGDGGYYDHGDLYDPSGGTWAQTPAMAHVHAYGAGAQLSNGDLLVIAGMDGGDAMTTSAVDIYSASGNTWSAGAALPGAGRYALTATAMAGGSILVAGGNDGTSGGSAAMSSVAIYTNGSGWASAESMTTARFDHAAVRLQDGRILVVGGSNSSGTALSSAELYDPSTGHWSATGSMASPRYGATLTLLNGGWVLVTGGYASGGRPAVSSAEIYDPRSGSWSSTGPMLYGRRYHSATLLGDGTVLVAGGHASDNDYFLTTAEVYTPPLLYPATTFHPLKPTRILDTRSGLGLTGKFANRTPRLLTVVGHDGVPSSAVAVTGIVTVTNQTAAGYISVGPVSTNAPTSSTLNFPYGDNRANNVTVALDEGGRLAFVLCIGGAMTATGSTDLIFDVTGYFTADDTGATWMPLEVPARVMDSRSGVGLSGPGAYVSRSIKTTTIWGAGGVPSGAVAVTGNLTVVRPSSGGWAFAGPSIPADPVTLNASMVNAQKGEIKADGVTVKLSETGTLSFVWCGGTGSTADLVFDVTGYFVNGTSGARFVPISPLRVADTRIGLPAQGPIAAFSPVAIPVAGRSHIPWSAVGMSGNLTVVGQSAAGYLTAAPVATSTTTPTSTLNFPVGDIRANGFDVSLASNGSIGVVYFPTAGSSTHFVVDLTGYFIH
jgi:N-acetylneuraminic acid mutarotase